MKKSCERIAAVLGLEKPILDGEMKPVRADRERNRSMGSDRKSDYQQLR